MDRNTFSAGAEDILGYFYDISQLPRQSGNNEQISNYLLDFAKHLNLSAHRDAFGNVIIYKCAQKGYEKAIPVIIQAHYDMVCEKEENSLHDFNNPLELCRDGDRLYANGTTLGADDGIGVASVLALLAGEHLHPALEAVFTSSEETDMAGARGLDPGLLKGELLLCMDSHALLCCGSGELEIEITIKKQTQSAKDNSIFRQIKVYGLQGGHTGSMAMEEPGSAIALLNRLLLQIYKKVAFYILSVSGGNGSSSAFAREACCTICYDASCDSKVIKIISEMSAIFRSEYSIRAPDLQVSFDIANKRSICFSETTTVKLLQIISLLPEGICSLNHIYKGAMESCVNCGVIESRKSDLRITVLIRSTCASKKYELLDKIELLCKIAGVNYKICHDIPQWDQHVLTEVLQLAKDIYYERAPEISQGTLECGVFQEKKKNLSILGMGVPYYCQHSPSEYMLVSEVKQYWNKLRIFLSQLKDIQY